MRLLQLYSITHRANTVLSLQYQFKKKIITFTTEHFNKYVSKVFKQHMFCVGVIINKGWPIKGIVSRDFETSAFFIKRTLRAFRCLQYTQHFLQSNLIIESLTFWVIL